jgi:hypothetical protein
VAHTSRAHEDEGAAHRSARTPPFNEDTATNTGAAYVFDRRGHFWHEIQRLQPTSADRFGSLLAATPTMLVSITPPPDRFQTPTLFVYEPRGLPGVYEIKDEVTYGDYFGMSDLAPSGNTALIGVPTDSRLSTGHVEGYENVPAQ